MPRSRHMLAVTCQFTSRFGSALSSLLSFSSPNLSPCAHSLLLLLLLSQQLQSLTPYYALCAGRCSSGAPIRTSCVLCTMSPLSLKGKVQSSWKILQEASLSSHILSISKQQPLLKHSALQNPSTLVSLKSSLALNL